MIKKVILFAIKAVILLGLGAYAATVYLAPPEPSPEQPWRARVVIDLIKIDGHFNVGIGWRKVEQAGPRSGEEF